MSRCLLQQKKYAEAGQFAEQAKQVYPQEAQAHYLSGLVKLQEKKFDAAYKDFGKYDQVLPGNPTILFLQGFALEGTGKIKSSAEYYYRYLQAVQQGPQAQHAYKRLVEWGYIKR
jgi:tetratricopeptide (TPR) repeat protein